ncbi:MAG: sigma-70 family RNA polymerase sigma factor [Deltaproteobacteria bacterium]
MERNSDINPDKELMALVKKRDKTAFREIYSRFSQVVFNLVYRILKDRQEAEEVVQEIFLQVWNKADSYDAQRGALSTWIINISRNKSIDRLRTRSHKFQNTEINEERLNSKYDFSRILENREERRKVLQEALNTLPQEQRTAIEMVYFEGFTHVETAQKLNEPVGTIKTRIRLGVMKLKQKIAPYFEELN